MNATPAPIRAATAEAIEDAADILRRGGLVAFPTETVYGLGADATQDTAVAAVFAVKDRPRFNPLIIHFAKPRAATRAAVFDEPARRLAAAFWPGPLTLVLRRRPESHISLLASAGLDTVAVRVPDHPVARALLSAASVPVAAPSANRAGAVSPTTARHVADSLDRRVAMILDGGPCRVGIESTVVDLTGARPLVLRPGGIACEAIEDVLGPVAIAGPRAGAPRSPGMLERHYAPALALRLDARRPEAGEAFLGFGPEAPPEIPGRILNLSPSGDLEEAAANLFAMLRALDRPTLRAIAVMSIPATGLGRAINDRLRRAARR